MTQLSENFTLEEMTHSQTAVRYGYNNEPTAAQIAAMKLLAEKVLQPIRDEFGPVRITSGFRGPILNSAIRGSKTSQHCHGEAADLKITGVSNLEVCKWIVENLEFDQLIYEFGEGGWVHISYRKGRLRNEVLSATRRGRRVIYTPGLPE